VTRVRSLRRSATYDAVDAVPLHPAQELVDPQMLGFDAVERGEGAAEHVVDTAVSVGPLHRDEVGGLLHYADHGAVPAGVATDDAELLLGQVPALAAEADPLLNLEDRVCQRGGLLLGHAQEVEREALGRPGADPG
jgi:hypothetical protein